MRRKESEGPTTSHIHNEMDPNLK